LIVPSVTPMSARVSPSGLTMVPPRTIRSNMQHQTGAFA
jgi:hypothetical protein